MKYFLTWLLIVCCICTVSAAPATPVQSESTATPPPTDVVPQQNGYANDEKTQKEQFSGLAFSSPQNTHNEGINVQMRSPAEMGTVMAEQLPVFGANLFGNQCNQLHPANFFNPDYRISVGDQVNVQMWGAYTFNQALTVDSQGNIFVPELGPVHVKGIENSKLNEILTQSVRKIFSKDVQVYGDLVTAQPVQVYVTGYVNAPGLYDGLSSDSVIYFLCKAGGINLKEGSLRDIEIRRQSDRYARVDLYDFMLKGDVAHFQLHSGDTIVVKPQAYIVSIDGHINHSYQYEFLTPNIPMPLVIERANIDPTVTFVKIQRHQGSTPNIIYKPLAQAKNLTLHDGDKVTFVADHELHQVIVTVKGQIIGKHQYVIQKGTTLGAFVKKLQLTPQANINNIQLFRESVAQQQKEAIQTSLSRLQRASMTTSAQTESGAKLRASQSDLVTKFISEAKAAEPKGQVVLGNSTDWDKVYLENNDTINIPQINAVVTISGDVVNAVSMKSDSKYTISDYLLAAGGVDKTANAKELLLVKESGAVQVVRSNRWRTQGLVEGGDQLIVLPQVTTENWQITESLSRIMYEVAIAAKVALIAV